MIIFVCFIIVAFKERPISEAKTEKAPAASKTKDKGGKGKGAKGDKGSRPPSQQFDVTKPNWTLRVVSDGSAAVRMVLLQTRIMFDGLKLLFFL